MATHRCPHLLRPCGVAPCASSAAEPVGSAATISARAPVSPIFHSSILCASAEGATRMWGPTSGRARGFTASGWTGGGFGGVGSPPAFPVGSRGKCRGLWRRSHEVHLLRGPPPGASRPPGRRVLHVHRMSVHHPPHRGRLDAGVRVDSPMSFTYGSSRSQVYCRCGFSCSSTHILWKHIGRWESEGAGKHVRVTGPGGSPVERGPGRAANRVRSGPLPGERTFSGD